MFFKDCPFRATRPESAVASLQTGTLGFQRSLIRFLRNKCVLEPTLILNTTLCILTKTTSVNELTQVLHHSKTLFNAQVTNPKSFLSHIPKV